MKKITRIVSLILLCCVVFIPAISAKAATQPVQPSGLGFYTQSKSGVVIDFAFDPNLPYYSPENPYNFPIPTPNVSANFCRFSGDTLLLSLFTML